MTATAVTPAAAIAFSNSAEMNLLFSVSFNSAIQVDVPDVIEDAHSLLRAQILFKLGLEDPEALEVDLVNHLLAARVRRADRRLRERSANGARTLG
jgi:hypothetical protein